MGKRIPGAGTACGNADLGRCPAYTRKELLRRIAVCFFLSPSCGKVLRCTADVRADRFAGSIPRSASSVYRIGKATSTGIRLREPWAPTGPGETHGIGNTEVEKNLLRKRLGGRLCQSPGNGKETRTNSLVAFREQPESTGMQALRLRQGARPIRIERRSGEGTQRCRSESRRVRMPDE
jgi:hypothetical protein